MLSTFPRTRVLELVYVDLSVIFWLIAFLIRSPHEIQSPSMCLLTGTMTFNLGSWIIDDFCPMSDDDVVHWGNEPYDSPDSSFNLKTWWKLRHKVMSWSILLVEMNVRIYLLSWYDLIWTLFDVDVLCFEMMTVYLLIVNPHCNFIANLTVFRLDVML